MVGAALLASTVRPGAAQSSSELVVAFPTDPQTLDPRTTSSSQAVSMLGHVYDQLVTTDEQGRLQPGLAERWELLGPQTIRFHLRRGVKFHNGEPFDAAAVKYSLESTVNPDFKSVQRFFLSAIDRVDVRDPYTADLVLKSPAARTVLRTLTYFGYMVPPALARSSGDRLTTAVGTGPYRFVEYRPGERLVVEQNRDYWGKAPGMPRIVFRVIAEPGTRVAAVERGEVDIAYAFPIDQAARFRDHASVSILSRPTIRVAIVNFRVDRKPVDDVRVRQAVAMALNRSEINAKLLGGLGRVANTILGPEVFGYAAGVSTPAYDPERAKRLLAEAGVAGATIRLGLSNGRFVNDRQIGEVVQATLEELGLRTEVEAPEYGALLREANSPTGKYDVIVWSWATNTLDADFTMTGAFHDKLAGAYTQYRNREVSELIDQARATIDDRQAMDLYRRVQEILLRDLPWVPLVFVPDVIGMNKRVQNFHLRADETVFFKTVTRR
jgi:peptide/nickel transport system substrate-binding protein